MKQIGLVLQSTAVKSIQWNPMNPNQFAICCSTGVIYIWNLESGCEAMRIPAVNFLVSGLQWNPDGKSLLLMDKDKFCVCFMLANEE